MKQKLRVFLTLLLCAVASVGWAEEVTYTISSRNTLTTTGTAPEESSATIVETYGTSCQMTKGNNQTLTLKGYEGLKITKLVMSMHSNASGGQAYLSYSLDGGTNFTYIVGSATGGISFSNASWNGSWSTSWVDIEKEVSIKPITGDLIIKLGATANSIYCRSYTITYENDDQTPSLSVNPTSIAFGEKAINDSYNETFDVYFANLTEDLTVNVGSGLTGVSVSSTTISKEATSPKTVTVTYAPTTVGIISGNITVSNTADEVSQTVAVTGSAFDPDDITYYKKVTSSQSDWSGDYVFTGINNSTYYALTGVSNNLGTAVTVNVTENVIISNSTTNSYKVTIAQTTNGYSLYMAGVGYLSYSGTSNQLHASNDFEASTCEWTISFANGVATITNVGANTRILQYNYNSGNPRFACYTTNQTKLTLFKLDDGTPSISADDVNIAYDAEGGSIEYTIVNPVEGTTLNALTTAIWLTLGEVGESSIPFTCSANETTEPRTAIVTLTYGEVTEDVTVTQAAAPVTYTTIPAIFDAATAAGSTGTNVNVTFGDWVVSGVSGSNVYVTDNNGNGFIIYKSDHGFTVNNKLSGTVFETPLKLYNGSAEFTNLTNSTTGLEVANDGSITVITDKTIADLGGVNTGAVITLSNLTYDGTVLSDGTNTIKPYNSLYSEMSFTSGKTYNVTGVYLNYGSTKEILPRSAADIEEVVNDDPVISVENVTLAYDATEGEITYTIGNVVEGGELTASVTSGDWLILGEIGASPITFTCEANTGAERTATVTLTYTYNTNETVTKDVSITQAAYVAPITGVKYVKVTSTNDITDGQYLIVYEDGSVAFNGGLETLDAVGNTIQVTINDSKISATAGTAAAEFTIDVTAGTLKSASGLYIGKTANSNGLDASSETVYTNTFSVDTEGNAVITASGNCILRYNSASDQIRFRYYKSGQKAIQLYKKVETVTVGSAGYTTYVTKNNVAIPEGVKVYIVTAINESSIHMEPVTSTIPANEPIIVNASSGEYGFPIAESATDISGNLLLASDGNVTGDGSTIYALGVGKEGDAAGKVGFYRVKSGAKVPAGKAYLNTSDGAKDFLNFDFGETDGIGQIEMGQTSNAEIYNLSGQRVNKAQKGIYIVNGKKIVIR